MIKKWDIIKNVSAYKDNCLLKQQFVKDEEKTIEDLITEATAKLGEKIEVKEMVRVSI